MARTSRPPAEAAIPEKVRPAYDAVVAKTDAVCRDHLTPEYAELCRRLPGVLDRNRLAGVISVNGLMGGARMMAREVQGEAVRKGRIPYLPGEEAGDEDEEEEAWRAPATDRAYQLKITLRDIDPPVWRRVRVPDCTLDELHEHVQTAMGWTNSHLHHFRVGDQFYGDPELMRENFADLDYKDST